mmetsp:Transcript_15143/g.32119  ORF Transcript_15143/g.32119 Transcript_15143/m.32119 type:complete len:232 (-) Transcript_15143:284-979(-)
MASSVITEGQSSKSSSSQGILPGREEDGENTTRLSKLHSTLQSSDVTTIPFLRRVKRSMKVKILFTATFFAALASDTASLTGLASRELLPHRSAPRSTKLSHPASLDTMAPTTGSTTTGMSTVTIFPSKSTSCSTPSPIAFSAKTAFANPFRRFINIWLDANIHAEPPSIAPSKNLAWVSLTVFHTEIGLLSRAFLLSVEGLHGAGVGTPSGVASMNSTTDEPMLLKNSRS